MEKAAREMARRWGKRGGRPRTVKHRTDGKYCRCAECRTGREKGAVETVMVEKEGVAAKREPAVRHIESGKVPAVERELDYADSQEWRPRRKG